jgi:N-methylhydantoinase B/oxoprolinase/acetone carboxylase alpha subunit
VIPPTRLDDDALEALVARMRNPEERAATFARSSRPPLAERRIDELCERAGARRSAERWTSCTRTRSASSAPRSRASRRPVRGRGRARGARRRADDPRAVTIAGDAIEIDFAGTARSTTATSTARSRSPARPATSSSAASPTRLPASGGASRRSRSRARGLPRQRAPAAAVAAGNVETSSRIVDVSSRLGRAVDVPRRDRAR